MLLLILFTVLGLIFTFCKIYVNKHKNLWEFILAILTFCVGAYGLYTQDTANNAVKHKSLQDSVTHSNEVTSLKSQIGTLSASIKNVTGISSELKRTVDGLDNFYKTKANAQDTVNEAITGENNFPILEASIGRNNSGDSILYIRLQNDGKNNIRLIHFELNTIDNVSFSKDISLLVRGSGPLIEAFKIPNNTSNLSIDGNVWWDGIDFRAYTYWLEFKRSANGLFDRPIEHFHYYGQNNGKAFDPHKLLVQYLKKSKRSLNNK